MDAGAIRRNYTYPDKYDTFTYGDLKKEVPFDSEMVRMRPVFSLVHLFSQQSGMISVCT